MKLADDDSYREDIDDLCCTCGQDGCPECDGDCWRCRGEGWGINGTDWDIEDPVNQPGGEVMRCRCCGGSGRAKDCTYW